MTDQTSVFDFVLNFVIWFCSQRYVYDRLKAVFSLNLDSLKDPCLARSHNCDDGSSISFWLQFISGSVVLRSVNVGFNVYVKNGKFFVNFQSADNRRWEIERSCISMGFFFVTATWRSTEGLFYYENGILVDVANLSVANSLTVNSNDVISVGFEDVSNVKRYSSSFIDDLMIWRRALNQNEVYTVYTNGMCFIYAIFIQRIFLPTHYYLVFLFLHPVIPRSLGDIALSLNNA